MCDDDDHGVGLIWCLLGGSGRFWEAAFVMCQNLTDQRGWTSLDPCILNE